jgi:transposase
MVLLSSRGKDISEISQLLDVSDSTVGRWIHRYEADGIEGLYDMPRPGTPRKADEAYAKRLVELVETDPRKIDPGCPWGTWTIERLLERMEYEGYPRVSDDTARRVLHAQDFAFLKPKLDVKNKQDPEEVKRFKRRLSRIKRGWQRIHARV